jgi:hypothetical protein
MPLSAPVTITGITIISIISIYSVPLARCAGARAPFHRRHRSP